MQFWSRTRQHFLFRVTLGYVTLAWLLVLAILVIFPKLSLPDGSVSLAIALLVVGLPVVLFLAWEFRPQTAQNETAEQPASRSRLVEIVIAMLVAAIVVIAVDQYILEEMSSGPAAMVAADPEATFVGNDADILEIGTISPTQDSRLDSTGRAHEYSIRLAFRHLGPIFMGSRQIRIEFDPRNDEGNPGLARNHAIDLARNEKVPVILGPVNSAATIAALNGLRAEEQQIALITSMSTARNLTPDLPAGQRDPNLFRMIADDAERMTFYAQAINDQKRNEPDERFLLLFEPDEYGRGLDRGLSSNLSFRNVESMSWCDALAVECLTDTVARELYPAIEAGEALNNELRDRLRAHEFDSIVLLGTAEGATAFAKGISVENGRFDYYFVGSGEDLFKNAPLGAIAIGNPVLDPNLAPDAATASQWSSIIREFQELSGLGADDFQITAYESAMVVHAALQSILRDVETMPPIADLRRVLIDTLESNTFESLEPWRKIEFDNGSLRVLHDFPKYNIERSAIRDDRPATRPWVKLELDSEFQFMEGPIRARLVGNNLTQAAVTLYRIEGGTRNLVSVRQADFLSNEAHVDFHIFQTGTYLVSVGDGNVYSEAETELILTPTYLLSSIAAFFGALIIVMREKAPSRERVLRILLGLFAGFVLTFSSFYGADVADWFPFPTFGDEPAVNAVVTGLIGGLIGPYVLAEAFLSWALVLSVHHAHAHRAAREVQ